MERTSLGRGLSVLTVVLEQGEVDANRLARELGMPLSTVYRYLKDLRSAGFVDDTDGEYRAGPRLGGPAVRGALPTPTDLRRLARPTLERLGAETSETAILETRSGSLALCLDQVESQHVVNLAFKLGQELPLHAGAGSRVLLAYAPAEVVAEVLENLERFTDATPTKAELPRQLETIRRTGFATSHGEYVPGAVAVACPVLRGDTCVCSLTVASTTARGGAAWQRQARRSLAAARATLEALV